MPTSRPFEAILPAACRERRAAASHGAVGKAPVSIRRGLTLAAANLAVLAGLLTVAETAARLLFPRSPPVNVFAARERELAGRAFVEPHPTRGFALVPGFESDEYRIDHAGFRGEELPADLARRRLVLALGESTTFGWEVKEGEDYPSVLRRRLDSDPGSSLYVINAGVPSYTSTQVVRYLEELLPRLRPELVLVSILWNDLWFSALVSWSPEVLVSPQPPAWRRFLLAHSGLYRSLALRPAPATPRVDVFNEAALRQYLANVRSMIDLCQASQARLVLVEPMFQRDYMNPLGVNPFGEVHLTRSFYLHLATAYQEGVDRLASERGVPVLSHRLSFRRQPPKELFLDMLHPSAAGNSALADDVAERLRELRLVP